MPRKQDGPRLEKPRTRTDEDALPAIFSYADARRAGLSQRRIYHLRDSGVIEPLTRGTYRRATRDPLVDPDLQLIAVRSPMATLCLLSALAFHGLTDEIPARIEVALPRGRRLPSIPAPIAWHTFDPRTFEVGRELHTLGDEEQIGIFSPERTLVDVFRLRHRVGSDLAYGALREWARLPASSPRALLTVAASFPSALPALRSALEVLL
ncbi:MAG: type IV toxin-antitoxin system AbiEi family antitoxin domain-containing protein [Actinomycetales bacterium]